jgi:hypothetical protein
MRPAVCQPVVSGEDGTAARRRDVFGFQMIDFDELRRLT